MVKKKSWSPHVVLDQNIIVVFPTLLQTIKKIAEKYLKKFATKGEADITYGLYDRKGNFYIGNKPVVIIDNNIMVDNEEYEGIPGLWELILSKNPDDSIYTNYDYPITRG